MQQNNLIVSAVLLAFACAGPANADFDADAPTVFITGANRGLGLEFSRQYADQGWNVIATCRRPDAADELQAVAVAHDQVVIETLDVTVQSEIDTVAEKYSDLPIDVLLNNAGIWGDMDKQSWGSFDYDEHQKVYEVNAIGPLRVTQALMPNVLASEQKKILVLGGGMAGRRAISFAGGHYFYRMSRAANLASMAIIHTEFKDQGVIVSFISPGKVDTQMLADSGWVGPSLSAEESARMVMEQIELLDPSKGAELINYDGTVIGW